MKENIEKIITDHELWLKSLGKQGARADFTGINLIGCIFEYRDLRRAIFKNAKMSRAGFYYCKLKEADFTGADLRGSYVCFCSAYKADFSGAKLSNLGSAFSDFSSTVFHNADMNNAKLYHVNLFEANLECFLDNMEIIYGNIQDAKFGNRETLYRFEDSRYVFRKKYAREK